MCLDYYQGIGCGYFNGSFDSSGINDFRAFTVEIGFELMNILSDDRAAVEFEYCNYC